MPQQLLNNCDVHAAVERVRCEGMAQQVRVDVLFQSCPLADRADNTLNCPRFERLVWRFAGNKQAVAALALNNVLLHHQPRTNREVHHTIAASTTALDAIYAKKKRMSGASASLSGKFIILQISNDNAFDTSQYGYATLSDGSKPNWDSYKGKYAYFKQYKKIATYMKNDTDRDDWIDYFQC